MLEVNIIFYFYIASGLVTGEWLPQDNGQDQMRYSLPAPQPQYDQRQFMPVIPEQSPRMPQAKPCRRRNYGGEIGAVLTDSGWVPLPVNRASSSVPARDQQTQSQLIQPQLKPQSLTENIVPAVDEKKEDAKLSSKSPFPNKNMEYVDKSSLPNQLSRKSYIDEDEDKSAVPDQALIDIAKYDQVAPEPMAKSGHPEHTSLELVNSHEISHECLKHVHPDQDLRYGNSDRQDAVKPAPNKPQEPALIPSDCVQTSRRSMQDPESDSRKFESSSLNEFDITNAETSSKLESNDDSKSDIMKSAHSPGNYNMKPYLLNPAKNAGKWQSDTHVSLIENGRVCYACSTYYDPSCWTTNATTTVKYCNKDNNACVSKMYKIDGKVILIRDCGHTCNDRDDINIGQKKTSCSMCHHDLCNGAALHGISALLVMLIISALKFTS